LRLHQLTQSKEYSIETTQTTKAGKPSDNQVDVKMEEIHDSIENTENHEFPGKIMEKPMNKRRGRP